MIIKPFLTLTTLSLLLLTGCSSSNSDSPQNIAISGLKYVLDNGQEGVTNDRGLIPASSGNVQFYLGNVKIGSSVTADQDALFNVLRAYFPSTQLALNATLYNIRYRGRG
jgi:hypothetical protein